jgi:negative regulator of flagellin synthesis FlgM
MNVNNNLQSVQSLFPETDIAKTQPAGQAAATEPASGADDATLSSAATLALQSAPDADVRMDKVAQVQQALAAGTYNVPSSEVAGKMIQQMLEK